MDTDTHICLYTAECYTHAPRAAWERKHRGSSFFIYYIIYTRAKVNEKQASSPRLYNAADVCVCVCDNIRRKYYTQSFGFFPPPLTYIDSSSAKLNVGREIYIIYACTCVCVYILCDFLCAHTYINVCLRNTTTEKSGGGYLNYSNFAG